MNDTFQILWLRAPDYSATADMIPNPSGDRAHSFDTDESYAATLGTHDLLGLLGHFAADGWVVCDTELSGPNGPLEVLRVKAYESVLLDDFQRGGTALMETTLFSELRGLYLQSAILTKEIQRDGRGYRINTQITRQGAVITSGGESIVRERIRSYPVTGFSFGKPEPIRWWKRNRLSFLNADDTGWRELSRSFRRLLAPNANDSVVSSRSR